AHAALSRRRPSTAATPATPPPTSTHPRSFVPPAALAASPPSSFRTRSASLGPASLKLLPSQTKPKSSPAPLPSLSVPHLPDWVSIGASSTLPTAYPITFIHREKDAALKKCLDLPLFQRFISDPLGRFRFREFLDGESAATELDMWLDMSVFIKTLDQIRVGADAITDIYLNKGSPHRVRFPLAVQNDVAEAVTRTAALDGIFDSAQSSLLDSLYRTHFHRYVTAKIVDQAKARLGSINLAGFMQGPGTSRDSVQRIRQAIRENSACTELLINYRKDGEPFYCLLCLLPLLDAAGSLMYYVGGQTDVTDLVSERKNMSLLIGRVSSDAVAVAAKDAIFSRPMQEYRNNTQRTTIQTQTSASELGSTVSFTTVATTPSLSEFKLSVDSVTTSDSQSPAQSPSQPQYDDPPSISKSASSSSTNSVLGLGKVFSGSASMSGSGSGSEKRGPSFDSRAESAGGKPSPDTYSRVFLFKKHKREIIFAAPDALAFFGQPTASMTDVLSSKLLHADVLDHIVGTDKAETKALRAQIKLAIKNNESLSLVCGARCPGKSKYFGRNEPTSKFGVLHLTPMMGRDANGVVYIGIFS
ncbi:hypothetical protein BOTBODRAFT_179374, partial [Botryobasidium botryosum FD-172 SS1]